jgi:phage protein D
MKNENFKIEIDGSEADDIYEDLISLEVEIDERFAGMALLRLPLNFLSEAGWSYLDDSRFVPWKEVAIEAGFDDSTEEIFTGYITHVKPTFAPEITQCYLDIWAMDQSVKLGQEEILKAWPNKKDSDIATEILNASGFTPNVDNIEIVHDEKISTIIQRETDLQFLNRLALRNGFEFYVTGSTANFVAPVYSGSAQPVLAFQFGEETNLNRFTITANGLTATNVGMFQVDRLTKEINESAVEASTLTALGGSGPETFTASGLPTAKTIIAMNPASGQLEIDAICASVFHRAQWFVTGEGEIAANLYSNILNARETVTIKGIGATYSGDYYVTHVTHSFTSDGYVQRFKVKRNALMISGSEDFSAS